MNLRFGEFLTDIVHFINLFTYLLRTLLPLAETNSSYSLVLMWLAVYPKTSGSQSELV